MSAKSRYVCVFFYDIFLKNRFEKLVVFQKFPVAFPQKNGSKDNVCKTKITFA